MDDEIPPPAESDDTFAWFLVVLFLLFFFVIPLGTSAYFFLESAYVWLRTGVWDHPSILQMGVDYLGIDFGNDWIGLQRILDGISFWFFGIIWACVFWCFVILCEIV